MVELLVKKVELVVRYKRTGLDPLTQLHDKNQDRHFLRATTMVEEDLPTNYLKEYAKERAPMGYEPVEIRYNGLNISCS